MPEKLQSNDTLYLNGTSSDHAYKKHEITETMDPKTSAAINPWETVDSSSALMSSLFIFAMLLSFKYISKKTWLPITESQFNNELRKTDRLN